MANLSPLPILNQRPKKPNGPFTAWIDDGTTPTANDGDLCVVSRDGQTINVYPPASNTPNV